jgi:hypothetical protein
MDPIVAILTLLLTAGASSSVWLPIAFLAYCAGRRQISLRSILSFAAVEATVIAFTAYWYVTNQGFQY